MTPDPNHPFPPLMPRRNPARPGDGQSGTGDLGLSRSTVVTARALRTLAAHRRADDAGTVRPGGAARGIDAATRRGPNGMNGGEIVSAFEALANQLRSESSEISTVELILVGGAAGLLSGGLHADRTTTDCDVALYRPSDARRAVEHAATAVASTLGLSPTWLNPGGVPWTDVLPSDWPTRLVTVFRHEALVVHAIGRFDLITLKLLAGRAQDIEDLEVLAITGGEVDALRAHLNSVRTAGWPRGAVDEALLLLGSLTGTATPSEVAPPRQRGMEHHDE